MNKSLVVFKRLYKLSENELVIFFYKTELPSSVYSLPLSIKHVIQKLINDAF